MQAATLAIALLLLLVQVAIFDCNPPAQQTATLVQGCDQKSLPTKQEVGSYAQHNKVVQGCDQRSRPAKQAGLLRWQSKIATNLLTFVNRLLRAQHNFVVSVAIFDCNPYEVGSYATLGVR